MTTLLASKLQKPTVSDEWISGENIIAVQHEAVQSKVLFITAPTGYGKTTFLTSWSGNLNENVAWLTVDETDNDADQFFRYIIYTVYSACNLLPQEKLQLKLVDADRNELNTMWNFYKELGSVMTKRVRLIIDDFHHITAPELLEMIQYFVMDLPESLKICFASRHLPPFTLALWQSLFTVTEVKMQHLRFTVVDMKKYLKNQPEQQQLVWQEFVQTEGWPAALRNVVQSQNTYDLQHSGRYTMNVLMNDLWGEFSSSAQHFLLTTSILNTMDQRICDALLGNNESLVYLKNLEEKGFFIEMDTQKNACYRYHPLFSIALQQKLQQTYSKEFVLELHKKAAGVYFQQGDIVRAITHALIGKAYPLASTWMMNHGVDIIKSRETSTFISWCREFEEAHIPLALDLQLLYAFSLLSEHQMDAADLVASKMTTQENRKEWNAFTSRSPSAPYDYFLIKSYITIIRMGGVTEIGEWLQKGFDFNVEKRSKLYLLPLQFNKTEPTLSRTPLGSRKMSATSEQQKYLLEKQSCQANKLTIIGYYHGIQAEILYMKGLMKESREHQVEALLSAHHFQDPGLLIPMYVLGCKLHMANGEMENAHGTLQSALFYTENSYWKDFLYAFEAFIYLKQSRLEEAEISFLKLKEDFVDNLQHPFVALVDVRLLLHKGHWGEALKKVVHVKIEALREGQIETFIEATILESLCYAYQEHWLEMAHSLHEAMVYSKEYDYAQLFIKEETIGSLLKEYVRVRKQQHDVNWTQVPYFYVDRLVQATNNRILS